MSEFLKVQEDLNAAKERLKNQCHNIVEKLRDMYHDSGMGMLSACLSLIH
jgi:WD and tetratricopeptide repeat-containing protein 1